MPRLFLCQRFIQVLSMPIYEYRCEACNHEFEALQKMSDQPLSDCPKCNQPQLKKKVSAAAFRLKGSGWYETDFKSGKKKNLVESSDSSGKSKEDGAAKKTENKPKADKTSSPSSSKAAS